MYGKLNLFMWHHNLWKEGISSCLNLAYLNKSPLCLLRMRLFLIILRACTIFCWIFSRIFFFFFLIKTLFFISIWWNYYYLFCSCKFLNNIIPLYSSQEDVSYIFSVHLPHPGKPLRILNPPILLNVVQSTYVPR